MQREREREKDSSSNEMATSQGSRNHGYEDFIDMEVSSSSNFLCYSISSPPQSREFEFQMCSVSQDKESTISPADELFYKGKLLPLHLPPRLHMVQKLLRNSNTSLEKKVEESLEENYVIPFTNTSSTTTTNTSTPSDSCNVSPSESCRVSSELNPDEYFFEWSNDIGGFIDDQSKKSRTKKLKQIKKSSFGQKLKASRAYLMSLFSKSTCSDEFCAKAGCNVEEENISKGNDLLNKYVKVSDKSPFGKIDNERYKICSTISKSIKKEMVEDVSNSHRRSFSGAIQQHSPMKCSSSSGSSSSSSLSLSFRSIGFYDLQLLKRSNSVNSEIESSIEGAIAHCKQSQQLLSSRKTVNEAGVCSLNASKISVGGDRKTWSL